MRRNSYSGISSTGGVSDNEIYQGEHNLNVVSIPISVGPNLSKTRSERKISNVSIAENSQILIDPSMPLSIPEDRATFQAQWSLKQRSALYDIDLGKIGLAEIFQNGRFTSDVLNHTEIHVLWNPHIPLENYITKNVTMSLIFNVSNDAENNIMEVSTFPSPFHAHIIFHPGHSVKIGYGKHLPWTIRVNVPDLEISHGYEIADVYIKLLGYKSNMSVYTKKRGVDLISMVPLEEDFSGLTFLRPRTPQGEWKIGNYKMGFRTMKDTNCLLKMSQYGVDIEGMHIVGKLSKLVKSVKHINLDDNVDTQKRVLALAISIMQGTK